MASRIYPTVKQFERWLRTSWGRDLSTRRSRFFAWLNFQLMDHAFLRIWWTNFDKVAEGVYRSNQPSPARIRAYRKKGIRTIINLRGVTSFSHYLFEKEACEAEGITLIDTNSHARQAPRKEEVRALIGHMRDAEKPFLMHCKSGADRAGFASVLYLILFEGETLETARRHLSFDYLHIKSSRTGILDHVLDTWEVRNRETGIAFDDWMENEYDRLAVSAAFQKLRKA